MNNTFRILLKQIFWHLYRLLYWATKNNRLGWRRPVLRLRLWLAYRF